MVLTCAVLVAGVMIGQAELKKDPQADPLGSYNVVWDSPSKDAHGSMPLGNGDVGINAWVDEKGDLVFYVSKTDAWDENAHLCKIGRVRVKFDPPLAPRGGFRQELKLCDGVIQIDSKIQNQAAKMSLWVDADQPMVRVEAEAAVPVSCRAEVELWRLRELLNHTFGASLRGVDMVKDGTKALKSSKPAKRHQLSVCVLAVVTQGYVLQRFMNACSGRGGSPIKFNGSIFCVEKNPGASPVTEEGDPDWRNWGGSYWFQNTRLSYWPMLAGGDSEMADPIIAFFDQYWQKRDPNGKIILDPAQSLEALPWTINPMPEIAGLHFILPRLLALPKTITTEAQRTRWTLILKELPPLPVADVNGVKLLRPSGSFSGGNYSENPELYAVFPYRLFGVGKPDLDMARATYDKRVNRHNFGWCQDSIQAACLGLGEEAGRQVADRAKRINGGYRFPAMWTGFDSIPDQDHGVNILTTLQCMLLQSDGQKIYVLPAWPKSWNVSFKLHAPYNTTVEGVFKAGKLEKLTVTPESRAKDVVRMDQKLP